MNILFYLLVATTISTLLNVIPFFRTRISNAARKNSLKTFTFLEHLQHELLLGWGILVLIVVHRLIAQWLATYSMHHYVPAFALWLLTPANSDASIEPLVLYLSAIALVAALIKYRYPSWFRRTFIASDRP